MQNEKLVNLQNNKNEVVIRELRTKKKLVNVNFELIRDDQ